MRNNSVKYYYKLFYTMLLFSMVFFNTVQAQLTGVILDNNTKQPVANASIISNNNQLTLSDNSGKFKLQSPTPNSIIINHVSYIEKKLIVSQDSSLTIFLSRKDKSISEIIVIGSLKEKAIRLAGSYSSLQPKNIIHGTSSTVNSILNATPGVYVQNGTQTTSRITIRGIGSRTPYSTNRIRAYLDEIPLTTGDGTTTLEDIELTSIGRIDILKGPSSAIYGSGLGGVIRLIPSYPNIDNFKFVNTFKMGSYGMFKYGMNITHKASNSATGIFYNRKQRNGYRQNNKLDQNSLFLNHHIIGHKHRLIFNLYYIKSRAEIPSSLNYETYLNNPQNAAQNWFNIKGFESSKKLMLSIQSEHPLSSTLNHNITIFTSNTDNYERRPFNTLDDDLINIGLRDKLSWEKRSLAITAGVELFTEQYNWSIINSDTAIIETQNKENRKYINTYATITWEITGKLKTTASANLNILSYNLKENLTNDPPSSYQYHPIVSPRLGFSYRLNHNTYLYTSGGHGFSAPSLEETLMPEGEINTHIKPEQGWNLDLGIRGHLLNKNIFFDITGYSIWVKDLLVTKRESEDVFYGINAGKTLHSGIEFSSSYKITTKESLFQLNLTTSYYLAYNKLVDFIDDDIDFSGNQLPGLPRHLLFSNLKLNSPFGIYSMLQWQYTGELYLNDANNGTNKQWNIYNFKLGWNKKLSNWRIDTSFGIENIFNMHYASMIVVNAQGFGGNAPRYYYPGLPRNYFCGISISYSF